jgi:hypothetical protein
MITPCNLFRTAIISASLLAMAPTVAPAQSCVPAYTSTEANLNPCSGTPPVSNESNCAGSISKSVTYYTTWPDTYSRAVALMAEGESNFSAHCEYQTPRIITPYTYIECWPAFYTPQVSSGSFVATAADVATTILGRECCVSTCTIQCATSRGCVTQQPAHSVSVAHACSGGCS